MAFFTYNDLCEIFGGAGFKGFKMFKDEECYEEPPNQFVVPVIQSAKPKTQDEFKHLMFEFGCPNLLFRCEK